MKVYISVDIEGITGVTHWDETDPHKADYREFQEQMTMETVAACEGALNAGATAVYVNDAHGFMRNIAASKLPTTVNLFRGRSGHPYVMLQGLDETFHAVILIGYHSRAGSDTNPLAHTMNTRATIKLNDRYASEFLLATYTAAQLKVPVVFVSGDQGLCDEVALVNSNIGACAVKVGVGNSTLNIHPALATQRIRDGVKQALGGDLSKCRITLPNQFSAEVRYREHGDAYRASFFPGARLKEPYVVQFAAKDFFDVLRLLLFTL